MTDLPELDLREHLVHIDQMLADIDQKREDTLRIIADHDRIWADRDRKRWQPIVVLISGLTAGAALITAGAVLTKLFE